MKRLFATLTAFVLCQALPAGWIIGNVEVELSGPQERLLVLPGDKSVRTYRFTAIGKSSVHSATVAEGGVEYEEGEPYGPRTVQSYTWSLTGDAIVVAGGNKDMATTNDFIEIRFPEGSRADCRVEVTYQIDTSSYGVFTGAGDGVSDGEEDTTGTATLLALTARKLAAIRDMAQAAWRAVLRQ